MASTLRFSVEVASDQATHALNVLSQSFNQAGISSKQALLGIGAGTRAAGEASKGFEGKLRSLKSEMASGDRTINFFARSLNNIVPEASAAGQGLRLLADGLIGGLGVGFALQGVMAILTLFGDKLKETEKKAAESAKEAKDAAEAWYQVGAQFEAAMAKIGAPKKSWQREQVEGATAETDKQIAEKEKRLREVEADLNQALRDRDNVGLIDNGAEERVVAALTEKQALKETLGTLRATREQQRAAAAERAEQVAAGLTDTSTATTFYQETSRLQGEATRKRIEDEERRKKESQARIDKLWWDNFNAQVAAERKRLDAEEAVLGKEMSAYYQNVLGGQYGNTKFAGTVDVPSLTDTERAASGAKILGAEDDANAKAVDASQKLTEQITATWIDALAQMVESTDLSAKTMVKLFTQLAAQLMQQAGFAMGGPIVGLLGAFAGKFLPSAAGGWGNVPNDTLAQIHKREMVLPEAESDVIRSLARNGGGPAPVQVTINAIDGVSVRDWIVRNGTDFSAGVRELGRQGR